METEELKHEINMKNKRQPVVVIGWFLKFLWEGQAIGCLRGFNSFLSQIQTLKYKVSQNKWIPLIQLPLIIKTKFVWDDPICRLRLFTVH